MVVEGLGGSAEVREGKVKAQEKKKKKDQKNFLIQFLFSKTEEREREDVPLVLLLVFGGQRGIPGTARRRKQFQKSIFPPCILLFIFILIFFLPAVLTCDPASATHPRQTQSRPFFEKKKIIKKRKLFSHAKSTHTHTQNHFPSSRTPLPSK